MLLQTTPNTIWFIVGLFVATIILWLVMYLVTRQIISKPFASDKKVMLLICAFLIVLLVPVVSGAVGSVLGALGGLIGDVRSAISSQLIVRNYLMLLVPIIAFLLTLLLVKFLIGVDHWDQALWIALISLLLLYLFYTIVPDIPAFLGYSPVL
ncbi:MAG: hypothetical protein ACTSU5_18175 [Promethearchaeota archaeon]